MGAWGSSLYSNDATCDVRDSYIELLKKQTDNEEAYKQMLESFQEYIGDDEEPLFWYALADTQWKTGRLIPEVKDKALDWIAKDGGLSIWLEDGSSGKGWQKTLDKLKERLNSELPPEKKFRKEIDFPRNPWSVGDVYAYQFHTKLADENKLLGKYILMQKIGETEYDGWQLSRVQVYNCVFDEIPGIDAIKNLTILPLTDYGLPMYAGTFESYLRAYMILYKKGHYPQKHLFFVGNQPMEAETYNWGYVSSQYWGKDWMEEWLIRFYQQWQNKEYPIFDSVLRG